MINRDRLEKLQEETLNWMEDKLNEQEGIEELTAAGPITVGYRRAATASDVKVITAFLKDNNVYLPAGRALGQLKAVEEQLQSVQRYSERGQEQPGVVRLPLPQVAVNQ